MVKIMENPIKMDDLGVPLFLYYFWKRPVPSLKLTASLPLKMDGWNTMNFPIGVNGLFSGAMLVSGRVSG